MDIADCDLDQNVKLYFRDVRDCALELLQDPHLKDHIDFSPKPTVVSLDGRQQRVFGTFSGGLFYQAMQASDQNGNTIANLVVYSDATSFFKTSNGTAHPVLGMLSVCCPHIVFID